MDVYLPADFRALRDFAADDWRDLSGARPPRERTLERTVDGAAAERLFGCADPEWRVF